ncbi:fungal-specific transcription factor domain-containing protein [Aspergillus avenaceus]|uniref:Fungal-specific transcription factor domain-containing protein n=1 Tax=Aspergillus avenaceus TaxID=36643 RepID=A0A5N6U1L1_ASPAV|nr:fungal-specific transcription factor domain-containing protein [Aspergillus avenaceus]
MDRGPLERQEADKIKREIARNGPGRRRRRSTASKSFSRRPDKPTVAVTQSEEPTKSVQALSEASNPRGPVSATSEGDNKGEPVDLTLPAFEEWTHDMVAWAQPTPPNTCSNDDFVLSPSPFLSNGLIDTYHADRADDITHDLSSSQEVIETDFAQTSDQETLGQYDFETADRGLEDLGGERHLNDFLQSLSALKPGSRAEPCLPFSNIAGSAKHQFVLSADGMSMNDAALLSNYFAKVANMQFPFSHFAAATPQWLYFVLMGSSVVLKITFVLIKAHNALERYPEEPQAYDKYEADVSEITKALATLPSPIATMSLLNKEQKASQVTTACAALLQTVYLDVLYGRSSHWEQCLKQAAAYVPVLIDVAVGSTNTDHQGMFPSVSRLQMTTANVLLGKLVWIDIIAAVSYNTGPLLGIDHAYLLDTGVIHMDTISDCESSVANALCKIADLQRWKQQAQTNKTLSIIQLATRASDLNQPLVAQVTNLTSMQQDSPAQTEGFDTILRDWISNIKHDITLVFAYAALIYLHVVVSGPNPHLPEINSLIKDSMEPIQVLARKRMLRHVSWPVCVIACFASTDERQIIREFIAESQECEGRLWDTCGDALNIADECQKLREEGQECDWFSVVERFPQRVLLI